MEQARLNLRRGLLLEGVSARSEAEGESLDVSFDRLVLEQGAAGHSYNVAAQEGVPVRRIVAVIAKRFGIASDPLVRSVAEVVAEQGAWALGPALDQRMSARKLSTTLGWQAQRTDALAELA